MNFLFFLIVGAVIGFLFYLTDRKRGSKWFKSWYDLTHKDPLESLPPYGMVFRRDAKTKITWSIALGAAAFLVLIPIESSLLGALLDGIGTVVGIALAFFVAPLFFKIDQQKVEAVLSKLDETKDQPEVAPPRPEAQPAPAPEDEKPADSAEEKASSNDDDKDNDSDEKSSSAKAPEDKDDWRGGVKKFLDS